MKAGTFRRDHATSQRFLRIWPSRSSPCEPLQTQPIKTFVNCSQCEPEPLSEQVAVPPQKHNDRNTHTLPLHGMQNKMRRAAKKKTPRRFLLLNRFVRKYSRRKVELQWTRKSERKRTFSKRSLLLFAIAGRSGWSANRPAGPQKPVQAEAVRPFFS